MFLWKNSKRVDLACCIGGQTYRSCGCSVEEELVSKGGEAAAGGLYRREPKWVQIRYSKLVLG